MFVLNKKNVGLIILFFVILFVALNTFTNRFEAKNSALVCIVTFIINGLIWIYCLFKCLRKYPYSTEMMLWVFLIFFMFVAGVAQYYANWYPWNSTLDDTLIFKTNIALTFFTLSVVAGQLISRKAHVKVNRSMAKVKVEKLYNLLPVLTGLNIVFIMLSIYVNRGLTNLLSRDTRAVAQFSNIGTVSMLVENVIQAFSYYTMAISIIKWKNIKNNSNLMYFIINAAIVLIGYFPIALPRYATAVIYLGLMLTYLEVFKNKKNRAFILVFVGAFCLIFPLLSQWRHTSFFDFDIIGGLQSIVYNFSKSWVLSDYDAYAMTANSIKYISYTGIAYGKYFATIMLFFIPRSIWKSKALAGSADIAIAENLSFSNISLPFPALGIMDFGFIGVILIGILIGIIVYRIDNNFWINQRNDKIDFKCCGDLLYPVIVIFIFFMARGDMLYTFPYCFAYLITWYFISFIAKKIRF